MLAVTLTRVCFVCPELERLLQRFEQALGYELGTRCQGELLGDHDELIAPEAAERIGLADGAVKASGYGLQEFITDAVAEGVVDVLEVVEIDEERRRRALGTARADKYLLDAVQYQGAVGKAGQRIMCREEGKLLLTAGELFVCSLALLLKALAHTQQTELEAELQDVQGLGERVEAKRQAGRRSR